MESALFIMFGALAVFLTAYHLVKYGFKGRNLY